MSDTLEITIERKMVYWPSVAFFAVLAFLAFGGSYLAYVSCETCVVEGCIPIGLIGAASLGILGLFALFLCYLELFDRDSQGYHDDTIRIRPLHLAKLRGEIKEDSDKKEDDPPKPKKITPFGIGDLITGKPSSWKYNNTTTDAKMRVIGINDDEEDEEDIKVRMIEHDTKDLDDLDDTYWVDSTHFRLVNPPKRKYKKKAKPKPAP